MKGTHNFGRILPRLYSEMGRQSELVSISLATRESLRLNRDLFPRSRCNCERAVAR